MNINIINKILIIHSKKIWMEKMKKINKEYNKTCKYIEMGSYLEIIRDHCKHCRYGIISRISLKKYKFTVLGGYVYNTWYCNDCDSGSNEQRRISKNYY